MSLRNKLLLLLQNDSFIYRLLLSALLVASPALHYLCFYDSFDPIYLRLIDSLVCFAALWLSFCNGRYYMAAGKALTVVSFLVIDNFILLSRNDFTPVYLLSSVVIFIALTLFCRKRAEFIIVCLLNLGASVAAYAAAPGLNISAGVLIVLLCTFTLIAYASFLVLTAYKIKFEKAVNHIVALNKTLVINDDNLRENRKNLNALINSLNDVIFEFDENKVCLNTWFRQQEERLIDPMMFVGRRLEEILGAEKAKKYNDAIGTVIETGMPVMFEFPSDFGTGKWFALRLAPVLDKDGKYTHRVSGAVTDISEQKKYADALKENEALLLEAQTIARTGNWWYDHQTGETFWSKNLDDILEINAVPEGITRYEYYLSLIHPDDRGKAHHYFTNLWEDAETSLEYKFITPQGNLKYFRALKAKLLTDVSGNNLRSVGVLQDITEAKNAEKKIKVSQAELMEAQAIAKIGNWKWDVILNKLSWSDEINNIFEIDNEQIGSFNFITLLTRYAHPADRHILRQHLKDLSKITHTSYEYRIITPNGNVKYLSIIVGRLIRRDDGTLRKVIGTLQDITDRKLAELGSQRTENKYRLILETINLPAVSIDKAGVVIFCNKYAANMLGYEQHEILGLNWLENFVPAAKRNNTVELFDNDSFKPQNINSVICRNGEQRIISWRNTISYDENGSILEVTGIGEDITERERKTEELISAKEEAERSSKFKSEFLSIMSHEIRTPMNAVIGTTNLLLSEDPKPDQLEYLNTLKFSGENLLAIINDILDYNKIEAGKLQLSNIPFNIYHLLQKIKKLFFPKAEEKGIDIELIIDEGIPSRLVGDQIRLGQILNNLVSNAIKFTHLGKVTIRLDLFELTNSQATVRFVVADTGIGIAPENLDVIFEPFEQETRHSDNYYGGTGLGLAITRRLVELHNSSISLASEPGKGTDFMFTISFDYIGGEEKKEDMRTMEAGLLCSSSELRGMRILVVDDNKMNLLIASKFLKKWQAEADEAASGREALEMVSRQNYDLIIMDLQMPGMDGFETSRVIKRNNPHIPIIALTADAMPETNSRAFAAGMCDYLTKPFVPQVLFEKVSRYYIAVES